MKKIILITMCFVTFAIQAQQIRLIPKVGVNIASMTNADDADARIGLNAGVAAEISIAPSFAVEPGVFYSMQGFKNEVVVSSTMKNDYINIPVLAKYYVFEGFNVFAGPQVGILVNSKASGSDSGVSASVDMKKMYKTIDFSAVLGIGYQTALGLNFSANYNLGLTNVIGSGKVNIAGGEIDLDDFGESKNNVIQVSVGWRF